MMNLISTWDTAIGQILYHAQTPLGVRVFSLITELGSGAFVVVALVCISFAFWRSGHLRHVVGLLVSVGGAVVASEIIKRLVERARPPLAWHAVVETGYSFPSNHATAAAALFGFLIYAAWKHAGRWRTPLVLLFSTIILLVGFSRLYLGVHYLSDVLGGFILGGLFVVLGAKAVQKFQARRSE